MTEPGPGRVRSPFRVHDLKVVAPYFEALLDGSKTFEVRYNDRAYQAGDLLRLREWGGRCGKDGCSTEHTPLRFTTREVTKRVTYVFSGDPRWPALAPGYVVLALADEVPWTMLRPCSIDSEDDESDLTTPARVQTPNTPS